MSNSNSMLKSNSMSKSNAKSHSKSKLKSNAKSLLIHDFVAGPNHAKCYDNRNGKGKQQLIEFDWLIPFPVSFPFRFPEKLN